MKYLTIILILFVVGCATGHVVKTKDTCEASYTSVFKDMSNVKMSGCGAKGEAESAIVNEKTLDVFNNMLEVMKAK